MSARVPEKILDFSNLRELSEGDQEFYVDMLQTFRDGCKRGLVDIEKNMRQKNFDKMADSAHKLCSSFMHMQANEVYKDLKLIEKMGRENDTEKLEITWKSLKSNLMISLEEVLKELENTQTPH
ncbi:MAG: hypothetical protein HUJ25_09295 [Crocinitomicaceae bacterium]|nr:hypothetical protein [Crocinitomicaceae bacterium]